MSEQERTAAEETERVRRGEQPEVEGHRVRRSDEETEKIRRDEGPDVEGHKVR
jgi:hypothetical protein